MKITFFSFNEDENTFLTFHFSIGRSKNKPFISWRVGVHIFGNKEVAVMCFLSRARKAIFLYGGKRKMDDEKKGDNNIPF